MLITCHNRLEKTVTCLDALFACDLPPEFHLEVLLVDDGSQDGTSQKVSAKFPQVRLIRGSGELYWGGGMRLAFSEALKQNFEYYLWLNDDTILYPDAVLRMFRTQNDIESLSGKAVIVIGTTCDSLNGKPTYGGQRQMHSIHKLRFTLITPSDRPIQCDTINGNCVLISQTAAAKVGNLDEAFVHSMGDIDYGLRAVKVGCQLWVMPGFAGTCSRNASRETFVDPALPLRQRLKKMLEPKGLPLSSWKVLTKRHSGPFWVVYWLWPYARVVLESLTTRISLSKPRS